MVIMGRVAAAQGLQGWIKVQPYTAEPGNLADYRTWWLGNEQRAGANWMCCKAICMAVA